MNRALVPLAPGFEEIEAITVIDILRRAGLEVIVAGTEAGPITASRQTRHLPDCLLAGVADQTFDLVVLPGGQPGTNNLLANPVVQEIVLRHHAAGRLVAAICAAPTVLAAHGLLAGRPATCHPSARAGLVGAQVVEDRVVVAGNIVTSQAAGTAMEFAFRLVELVCGRDKAAEVNHGVLARVDY